jgi:hypothetical protein
MKLAVFERVLRECKVELSDCDPALIATTDAVALFDVLNAIERTIVAAKTLVAGRATDSGLWRSQGHRSPASWVAQTTGSSEGDATGLLQTSERLVSLPETTEALRRGELSAPQLKEIAAAASVTPAAEKDLIAAAARHGLRGCGTSAAG